MVPPFTSVFRAKFEQVALLWFEGFADACCIHHVFILFFRSRKLLIRTGQCFLLNGFIFLGSILVLNSAVIPTLQWMLPDQCPQPCPFVGALKFYSFLRHGLVQLLYVFWFYPLYIFSFVLSYMWYNDIAKYGFVITRKCGPSVVETSSQNELVSQRDLIDKPAGVEGVMIGIAEQIYSVLLLTTFSVEVYAMGFVPYFGKALSFLLLSWMYAYYCFEYKWNLSQLCLERRLDIFESNWAYFAGFGNPCVLAIFFFRPLVSYGVMAILFPLFVLAANCSEADLVVNVERRKEKCGGLRRLPIFYVAETLSTQILLLIPVEPVERKQDDKIL